MAYPKDRTRPDLADQAFSYSSPTRRFRRTNHPISRNSSLATRHSPPPTYRPFSCGQWQSTPGPLVCLLVGRQPECLSDSDFPEFVQAVRYGVPGTPPATVRGRTCVSRYLTSLVRKPGAGNPPARFDERGVETEHGRDDVTPATERAGQQGTQTVTVATLPGDLGLIPIAKALKSATSRTGGKPNVIARGPEPCSPVFLGRDHELAPVALLQSPQTST